MSLNHGAFQPGSAGSVVSKENFISSHKLIQKFPSKFINYNV